MSQAENPERLIGGRQPTIEDIHELTGPATPAFALQLRERVRRLIAPLPPGHPVRTEGERAIKDLDQLAYRADDPHGAIGPGETVTLKVGERGGVPKNAKAVALNVTVTGPTAPSYLTVWPSNDQQPLASSLNMVVGQTVPNMVILPP